MFLSLDNVAYGQELAIGQWMDHLPYNHTIEVAEAGSKIYCATESALFYLDKTDYSLNRVTKVNQLSDVEVSTIRYSATYDALIIGFANSNIDVLRGTTTVNVPDIKRKNILGNKEINTIAFHSTYAYISCGFGIVVFDMTKDEIKDTYYVNQNLDEVNQIVVYQDSIFAATESGLYNAPLSGVNLSDFNSWSLVTSIPPVNYNTIAVLTSRLFINESNDPSDDIHNDTLYMYNAGSWSKFDISTARTTHRIESNYNKLLITGKQGVSVFNSSGNLEYTYSNTISPKHAILDKDGVVRIADNWAGLVENDKTWGVYPNGPPSNNVFGMAIQNEKVWVAPGGRDNGWANIYNSDGIFSFIDYNWDAIAYSKLDSTPDIIIATFDPANDNRVYAGSWGYGLLVIEDGKMVNVYKEGNTDSVLQSIKPGKDEIRIGGLAFDENNNLWASCSQVDNLLCVRKTNGSWRAFQFSGYGFNTRTSEMLVEATSGDKWVLLPNSGILVFDDNETIDNTGDDQHKTLVIIDGSGNTIKEVVCMAQDHDGEIWVGTIQGVAVYYSPELAFSSAGISAQQILIEQDGHYQYLLETEHVTAIAIDGANRKWFGTGNSGVYLMSEDGTEELLHFTEDNSPLFSNSITSIAINHSNGEVFFGTDKGLISYKGTATEGKKVFTNVYSYPNPVREDYDGVIAIKGLVKDADVKITDISGNLIYQTTSIGGQAIWNGKNSNGDRAHTGVYLVFATNEDGKETVVTKILFIN